MISYTLLFNFSTNITGEAAGDNNLCIMSAFIVLSEYIFNTSSSAENIEYNFLNRGCWLSSKSMT